MNHDRAVPPALASNFAVQSLIIHTDGHQAVAIQPPPRNASDAVSIRKNVAPTGTPVRTAKPNVATGQTRLPSQTGPLANRLSHIVPHDRPRRFQVRQTQLLFVNTAAAPLNSRSRSELNHWLVQLRSFRKENGRNATAIRTWSCRVLGRFLRTRLSLAISSATNFLLLTSRVPVPFNNPDICKIRRKPPLWISRPLTIFALWRQRTILRSSGEDIELARYSTSTLHNRWGIPIDPTTTNVVRLCVNLLGGQYSNQLSPSQWKQILLLSSISQLFDRKK